MLPGRIDFSRTILIVLIFLSFILRLRGLDYPLANPEVQVDYLIAKSIVVYHKIALLGPTNSVFKGINNTPSYDYLLAFFMIFNKHLLFLGFINVLFQTSGIALVYFLGKNMFGKKTGLLAAILFSFSQFSFHASEYPWQPYVIAPLVLLSAYLLLRARIKRTFYPVVFSIIVFALALSIHLSIFAIFPPFLFFVTFILKEQRRSIKYYLIILLTFLNALLILYSPLITFLIINQVKVFSILFYKISPATTASSIFTNVSYFINLLFIPGFFEPLRIILIFLSTISGLAYYLIFKKEKKAIYFMSLIVVIGWVIFLSSFIKSKIWSFHFSGIIPFFVLLISESALGISQKIKSLHKFKKLRLPFFLGLGAYFILIFIIFSGKFYFIIDKHKVRNLTAVKDAVLAIKKEVLIIKKLENYTDLHFFDIIVFKNRNADTAYEALVFWIPLEDEFNTKFVNINRYFIGDSETQKKPYAFLICNSYYYNYLSDKACMQRFNREFPRKKILNHIYCRYPFSIYSTEER